MSLNNLMRQKIMKKILLLTTFLVVLFFMPLFANACVIINEICWMGTENSTGDEWIELFNTSSSSVDLTGWKIEAQDGSPSINLSGTIPANQYFLLERTDDSSVPSITADQIYTGALGNTGEYLKLKNSENNVIDEINATDEWPAGNNETKQTMERINNNWQTSLNTGGTPKNQNSTGTTEETNKETEEKETSATKEKQLSIDAGENIIGFIGQEIIFGEHLNNEDLVYFWNMGNGERIEEKTFSYIYSYPGTYLVNLMAYDGREYISDTITVKIQNQEIAINEFLPNPKNNGEQWIEIYNNSNSIVNISNWQLDSAKNEREPFIFPENTLIAPKSYLVFTKKITNIDLDNNSGSIRLLLPEGIIFQEITYENAKQEQSSAHTEEGFV